MRIEFYPLSGDIEIIRDALEPGAADIEELVCAVASSDALPDDLDFDLETLRSIASPLFDSQLYEVSFSIDGKVCSVLISGETLERYNLGLPAWFRSC